MTNIQVKQTFDWFPDYVSVVVDGVCDHAGAEPDDVDYGGLQHDSVGDLDWSDDIQKALVCKCGHIENIYEESEDY